MATLNEIEQVVAEKICLLKDDLISLTQNLINIPTVNPPGKNYEKCVQLLSDKLRGIGFDVKIVQVPREKLPILAPHGGGLPRPNLLAKLPGEESKPSLHFNGHYDVVPAMKGWNLDPFKSVIKNGKIYGRGSADMKGGIASMIIAADAIVKSGIDLRGALSFSATPDEETDGFAGSGFITKEGLIKSDYCIIGEPSGIHNVFNSHKGSLWLELITRGKATHGSTPWLGINAFEKMVTIVNAINKELKPKLARKKSNFPTIPPKGNVATITIGGLTRGGTAINTVPEICSTTIDRRFIPEETIEDVKSEIFDLLEKLQQEDPELKIETKIKTETNACSVPRDSFICETVMNAVRKITKREPSVTMCLGSLDTRYFVEAGVPTVSYGPSSMEMAHTKDECVSIEDLITAAKVYALSAIRILA